MKGYYRTLLIVFCCCSFVHIQPVWSDDDPSSPSIEWFCSMSLNIVGEITGNSTLKCIAVCREHLYDDIYKYSYIIRTGPGIHEKIGVYRVVKEKSKKSTYFSIKDAVFLIHGDYSNFSLFISQSEHIPEGHALGIYLAQKDIDVWGIDLRWVFLPDDIEDFSFMKGWNTKTHLADIKIAVKFARVIRALTGSGYGKITLSGFSRGVQYVYAYANEETQILDLFKDVKAIVPIASQFKASPESQDIISAARGRYYALKQLYDSETYHSDEGLGLKYLSALALSARDDPSDTMPGMTNRQALLFIACATFATFVPPEGPYAPNYHFTAGLFDNDIPYNLAFTDEAYLMDIISGIPSYQSIGEILEGEMLLAGIEDLPYDDHLKDITVPVLYVDAAGGEGEYGEYTLSLLGSDDKSSLIVSKYPPEFVTGDYGHLDLLTAEDADKLVWKPVYQWIVSH